MIKDVLDSVLSFQRIYKLINIKTWLGYGYITKKAGKKGFCPEGKIPYRKINAIQAMPGDIGLVLDIDVRCGNNGNDYLPCPIPKETPEVQTQSVTGRQYWFKGDPRLHTHADAEHRIDVLTGTSRVFLPPTQLENGGTYTWIVPLNSIYDLKPLPEPLFEFLYKLQNREKTKEQQNENIPRHIPITRRGIPTPKQMNRLYDTMRELSNTPEGSRSEKAFKILVWGLSIGLDEKTIWDIVSINPYFHKRGHSWYEHTLKNAKRKLNKC